MSAQENCQEIEEEVCSKCGSDDIQHDDCWSCGGTGGRDWEELQFEDPLWYDEESFVECDVCGGTGTISVCLSCVIRNEVMNKYYRMSLQVQTLLNHLEEIEQDVEKAFVKMQKMYTDIGDSFAKLEHPMQNVIVFVPYYTGGMDVTINLHKVESVMDVLKSVALKYREIYQEPDKYGVFGHSLEDLYFEVVIVNNNSIAVHVGS